MPDTGAPRGPTVAIPPSRSAVALAGLFGLAMAGAAAVKVVAVLRHPPLRLADAAAPAAFALFWLAFPWIVSRIPETVIGPVGLRLSKRYQRWESIHHCSWGHYDRGELHVQTADTRMIFRVPERLRSEVERAVRHYGKWAD